MVVSHCLANSAALWDQKSALEWPFPLYSVYAVLTSTVCCAVLITPYWEVKRNWKSRGKMTCEWPRIGSKYVALREQRRGYLWPVKRSVYKKLCGLLNCQIVSGEGGNEKINLLRLEKKKLSPTISIWFLTHPLAFCRILKPLSFCFSSKWKPPASVHNGQKKIFRVFWGEIFINLCSWMFPCKQSVMCLAVSQVKLINLKRKKSILKKAFRRKLACLVPDSILQSQHQTAVTFLLKAVMFRHAKSLNYGYITLFSASVLPAAIFQLK